MHGKPLAELLEPYAASMRAVNRSPFTVAINLGNLRLFLAWLERTCEVRTLDRLRELHLRAWQKSLAERWTPKGRPLKPRSVNKHIEALRSFLTFLHRHEWTVRDLTGTLQYVKVPQLLPQSVLTHAQVRRLLARIDLQLPTGYRNRAIIELMYTAGLRAREVTKLDVADLDLDNAVARIQGKGGKERMAPIGRTALRYVETYVAAVRPFARRNRAETALFLTSRGERVAYPVVLRIVHECADRAGLDVNVTPHTFRRSCTSELVKANANIYHVKELLGHATMKHLQPYIRLNIADLKKTHAKCHPRERDEIAERG